jgi:hypothetical protein
MHEYRTALDKSQKEIERMAVEMARLTAQNHEYQV